MAQRRRRKYGYKFTEKTQSKKGIAAFILAVLSIAIFIYVIVNSFHHGGNGSMYLGSAGVSSMLVALVAVVLAVMSLREEESFKLFPYMSTVLSFSCSRYVDRNLCNWIFNRIVNKGDQDGIQRYL